MARFVPRDEARVKRLADVIKTEAATNYEARQKNQSEKTREQKIRDRLSPAEAPKNITNAKEPYIDQIPKAAKYYIQ